MEKLGLGLLLAAESPAWKLVAIAVLSILLGAFVLFLGDFRGSHRWSRADTLGAVTRGAWPRPAGRLLQQ